MPYHLLAITDPGCSASTRYRVEQHRICFEELGIGLRVEEWSNDAGRQGMLFTAARDSDAVLFQRFLPNLRTIKRFRQSTPRLLYDFDDAVMYVESSHRRTRVRPERWLRFVTMVRASDLVTAGNPYLAALAAKWATGPVRIVPTTVDVERYDREPDGKDRTGILGWIGGRWTLPYLERLHAPLAVLSEQDGLSVRVIADQPLRLAGVRSDWVVWDRQTEVRELKRVRLGLAPLPDDRWTRGKCGLRLLQYMAAGLPAVASPVGVQKDLTAKGAALAAERPDDWLTAVRRLLTDPALAEKTARRGKELVRQHFASRNWGPELARLWCEKTDE